MKSPILPLVLVLSLLALRGSTAEAQRYHVHTYTENEGLPSSTINDVVQDPSGRIWVATRAGIGAYDGVGWTTFVPTNPLSPGQTGLAVDEQGTLWSVRKSAPFRVSCLRDGRWRAFSEPPEGAGRWGVTTAFAVTMRDERPRIAVGTERGALFLWDGERWRRFTAGEGLPVESVSSIVGWEGRFFVATRQGLAIFDDGAFRLERFAEMPSPAVVGLAMEAAGEAPPRLWMAGWDWLGIRQGSRFRLVADALTPSFEHDYQHLVLEPDRRGGVFFGNPLGLGHFDPQHGQEELDPRSGLIARGTTSLYLDREENLWVGSLRGLSKIVSFRFATYDQQHGLFENEVTAVIERRRGGYVFGHPTGLTFFDAEGPRTLSLTEGRVLPADAPRVLDLAEDEAGHLWVAASHLGLARIEDAGRVRWYLADPELPMVVSVLVDSQQTLWAATADRLYRWRNARLAAVAGAPGGHYRRLFQGASGELFLATQEGLYRLVEGRWSHFTSVERGANNVYALLRDSAGKLWVGTLAGLFRCRGTVLERVAKEGFAVSRPVYFVIEDRRGRLWFGTDNGVMRWDDKRLRHFTVFDGLGGRETNRAAGFVDSQGRVWIGTDRGVTVYRDAYERRDPVAPRVEFLALEAGGERRSLARPIHLEYHQNDVIFHFRALSFIDENRLRFRSRLEGFEADWLAFYTSPRQELRYTRLAPGRYRFHLQVENADGLRSAVISSAEIVIARPFWRWPSFYAALAVAFGGCLVASHRYLAQRRYARLLETRVKQRTAELRESERTIKAEKERLEVTLNSIGDGVITAAMDQTVLLLNPAAEKITGWSRGEAEGKKLTEIFRLTRREGESREAPDPVAWIRSAEGPVALCDEVVLLHRHGESRELEISGAPLGEIGGARAGVVLAFRDVTDRRRIEDELAKAHKLEALGLLAGGIAHDFNNLLTVVLGNLSILELTLAHEQKPLRLVTDATAAVLRARDLTQQLLTFSRGGAPIRKTASIAEIITDSTAFVLSGSAVRHEISLPDDLWMVRIDAGQMNQVLNNLLINAMQAMPDGGVVRIRGCNRLVDASSPSSLAPGRYVLIEVEDDGPGIGEELLARIFDPYFTTKKTGSGLGLATAYSIVSKHDGLLSVESPPGRGATFRLHLPAVGEVAGESEEAVSAPERGEGRILVLDDEAAVATVAGMILTELGYRAELTRDGRETVRRYREALEAGEGFDAVILDLTIPGGLGGRETLERLRQIDPEVRAVAASGYSNDPIMSEYRKYGFQAVIPKPFGVADLARVMKKVLEAWPETP